jgi:heme/copper-type cytochrome/quinol oxidase subunit 2
MHYGPGGEEALATGIGVVVFAIVGLIVLGLVIFAIICWWKIFAKAGYSGAMGLLLLVPFGELIMLLILAFGKWPALQDLARLRQQLNQPRP